MREDLPKVEKEIIRKKEKNWNMTHTHTTDNDDNDDKEHINETKPLLTIEKTSEKIKKVCMANKM